MDYQSFMLHKSERRWWHHGKIVVLTFSDAEEEIVNRILESLAEKKFQLSDVTSAAPLVFDNMTLYPQDYRIEVGGESLALSRRQFSLLHLLARNGGRIFSKEQLYLQVWEEQLPINVDETIRYHISEIRKKINKLAGMDFIETVWGIGYRFRNK